jgi:chromosome segregation ATPase
MSAELMRSYLDILNEQHQLDEDWQHKMAAMSMAGVVDVLNEDNQLDEDWRKKLAAAGMAGVMGLSALGGAQAADMPGQDSAANTPVATQSAYSSMIELENKVKDLAKVDARAAKSYEATKNYYTKLLGKAQSSEEAKKVDQEYAKSLQNIIRLSAQKTPPGGG